MHSRPRSLVAVTVAALMTLPAPALAQSAGDEQYSDPFQGTTETAPPRESDQPAQLDQAASGVAPAPAASPTAAQAQAPPQTESLPYTGGRGVPLAGLGGALLVLGFALRRLARPAYRMFY